MMGDDGEKFGAWPTTWEHCWGERRWVERFFVALEHNADWLTTTTPSDWLAGHRPIGRVYVPTSSYVEMGEWALPADESRQFSEVLHAAQKKHQPEARWLRGAFWRNFQVKYREINDLHKQMLRTSDKVQRMAAGVDREQALDHLYQGQSNDCYWHGLFGGIYIGHMRLATYEHLIAAEDLADRAAGRMHTVERRDLDLDGLDDVRLAGPGQVVTIHLTDGAGIGSWDIRPVRHALGAVMRRRPEAYHETLRRHEASAATPGAHPDKTGDGPTSIHDMVLTKEAGLSDLLHYDPFERRSGLVRFLDPATDAETWAAGRAIELGDAVEAPFEVETLELDRLVARRDATVAGGGGPAAVTVTKELVLGGDRRTPTLSLKVSVDQPLGAPDRGPARPRMDHDAAGRRRQSGGVVGGRRHAFDPRLARNGPPGDRLRAGQRRDRASHRQHGSPRPPSSGGRRSRPCRTRRPASSASTRGWGCSSAGR